MTCVEDIIQIGFSYHQNGNLDDAEKAYQEALNMGGENSELFNLIGVLKLQRGDASAAIEWIEKAFSKQKNEYFLESLLQAYIRAEKYDRIIEYESTILQDFSNNFSLLFNLALAYKNLKNNKEAIKYYNAALKINPASYQAWFNLANIYSIENDTENAVSAMKVCKKIKPNDLDTDYFLSLALMRAKDYKHGLKYFEARISKETAYTLLNKTYPDKFRSDNQWRGENIKNKRLYVYYEAGFGDFIMFSRYLPLVAEKCKELYIMPQKPLAPLYEDNLNLGIDRIFTSYIQDKDFDFDVHAPLLSLPYLLGLKGENIFAYSQGYLRANKVRVRDYKIKYFDNNKIKVGIKWQGNTTFDKDRVIPTEEFIPLLSLDNTQFYSFQTFEGSSEVEKLDGVIDIGKDLKDFAQTAAALSNLDLVICNDTSLAHLAGAMGIPCWVLLPYEVNWRWHGDLSICDWYDSVRLFRQHSQGDWKSVFEDVMKACTQE